MNSKMKKQKKKSEKGITLIALVITIIVLLILAGVSISALGGENGILKNAAEAKEESDKSSALEGIQLEAFGAFGKGTNVDMEDLKTRLEENLGATVTEYGENLIAEYKGYKFLIDKNGNVTFFEGGTTLANAPELTEGMIPVKWDTTKNGGKGNWVICSRTDEEWYSYTEEDKKWANVMLSDGTYNTSTAVGTEVAEEDLGSMFVWVPRYAYKITSGYHAGSGTIDVIWVSGTSYNYMDEEGNVKTAKNGNEEGVITSSGYTDYVVHPAFTNGEDNGYSNGEWKEEIEGIWVAKFQAGFGTTEKDTKERVTIASSSNSPTTATTVYYPVFKGRKYAYNYVSASQCYDISQALDDSNNPYGLTTSANSHLMKSSEWGAVAYLSISKYGYSEGSSNKEKAKNNLSIVNYNNYSSSPVINPNNSSWKITAITGYSAPGGKTAQNVMSYSSVEDLKDSITGTNGTSYAWNNVTNGSDTGEGTKSSTTGNIYGIYDMGGCLADYTASYVNAEGVSYLTTYGGRFADGTSTYLATAYPYPDPPITTDYKDFNSAYPAFSKIFGDALYETSSNVGSGKAWFGQTLEEDAGSGEVFFPRGGYWGDTASVGFCGLYDYLGNALYHCGFHSVLVAQ